MLILFVQLKIAYVEIFNSLSSSDMARSSKQDDIDDDEDGPPPGWEFSTLVNALPKVTSSTTGHIFLFAF